MVPLCRFFKRREEIYGYLPIEVQTMIAEKMDVTAGRNIRRFYFLFVVCIDTKRKI